MEFWIRVMLITPGVGLTAGALVGLLVTNGEQAGRWSLEVCTAVAVLGLCMERWLLGSVHRA